MSPTPDRKTKAPGPAVSIPNDPPPAPQEPTLQEFLTEVLQTTVLRRYDPDELDPDAEVEDPKSPASKRGRKPFKIDEKVVFAMALNGSKQKEIARYFGCSPDVIKKRFGDIWMQGQAARLAMLRQGQTLTALNGNAAMLIWLGKQELKQIDESRVRIGNLANYTDEELEQIAKGKLPGQLNRKDRVDNPDDSDD